MEHYQFSFPTLIHFGNSVRNKIAETFKQHQVTQPLIITDAGIAKLELFHSLERDLKTQDIDVETYSNFAGNPIESHVVGGVEAYKATNRDSILALGGGAAVDVAKAVALLATHPGTLFDYEEGIPNGRPIDQEVPFLAAVPTTAGTGSEVGRSSVISDNTTKAKRILFSPKLLPQVVFADPELTIGLPAHITAATGMDALTHCVEAFITKGFHPICDGIGLEGIYLIANHLEKAVKQPTNRESRGYMLLASMMGAIAFQKGLGITHSCAHALSTLYDFHHGLANGVMIPYCMEFNQSACEDRFRRMSATVGHTDFVAWLHELKRAIDIPQHLNAEKVTTLEDLVEIAFKDPCHQLNPRSATKDDFTNLYRKALNA